MPRGNATSHTNTCAYRTFRTRTGLSSRVTEAWTNGSRRPRDHNYDPTSITGPTCIPFNWIIPATTLLCIILLPLMKIAIKSLPSESLSETCILDSCQFIDFDRKFSSNLLRGSQRANSPVFRHPWDKRILRKGGTELGSWDVELPQQTSGLVRAFWTRVSVLLCAIREPKEL